MHPAVTKYCFLVIRASRLTTLEVSRAGFVTHAHLGPLDELRHSTGDGSGEWVRHEVCHVTLQQ